MQLNRREFGGHLVAGAAIAAGALSLEACAPPNWITVALNDLPTILTIAGTVATIVVDALGAGAVSPAIGALIAAAIAAVNVAIPVIQKLIADYQSTPNASILQDIKTALLDVQGNLSQILDAAHILNPALRATITTTIGLAIGVVTAILSLLPTPVPVVGAAKAKAAAQSGWVTAPTKASTITAQLNAFLTENGYGQYVR